MVYDRIELPPVRPDVTRVRLFGGRCSCCGERAIAPAPAGLEPGSPFGRSTEALVVYLHYAQAIGLERLRLLMGEVFGLSISEGATATSNAMVRLLASVVGVGVETADMLVQEVLSRNLRDRRAAARYAGLTGSPDESGSKRREKGLAKSGNARVRRGLIQLAWRFLLFQKDSALAQWYRARTGGANGARKTTMIVALARKLLMTC